MQQPRPEKEFNAMAILSLVSGVIVMLVVGSLYTFGTLSVYMSSYLRINGSPDVTTVTVGLIFPFILIMMNAGLVIGSQLVKKIDPRIITLGSFLLYSGFLFLLSYLTSFIAYIAIYGVANGLFLGLPYILPINNACQYLPKRKGLVSGICIMGLGFGALIFNQIIVASMNPNNIPPDSNHYFPPEVANNLPRTWKILAGVYLGIAVIGTSIMIPKKKKVESDETQSLLTDREEAQFPDECQTTRDALTQPHLYVLIFLIASTTAFGMFIAFNYKEYGLTQVQDDKFLTLVGSIGGIANGFSRIFWGTLLDFFSFRILMVIVNTLLLACCLSIDYLAHQKIVLLLYVVVIYFLYGGLFSLMPAKTYQLYGQKTGARIYSYAFLGFSLGSGLQFILHYFLVGHYGRRGWTICFWILAALQSLALIGSIFSNKLQINWRRYYKNKINSMLSDIE